MTHIYIGRAAIISFILVDVNMCISIYMVVTAYIRDRRESCLDSTALDQYIIMTEAEIMSNCCLEFT